MTSRNESLLHAEEFRAQEIDSADIVAAYELPAVALLGVANGLQIPIERRAFTNTGSLLEPRFLDPNVVDERITKEDYDRLRPIALSTLRTLLRYSTQKVRLKRQLVAQTGISDTPFCDTVAAFGKGDWMWEMDPETLATVLPDIPTGYNGITKVAIATKLRDIIQEELIKEHRQLRPIRSPEQVFSLRPPAPESILIENPDEASVPEENSSTTTKPELPFSLEEFRDAIIQGKLVAMVTESSFGAITQADVSPKIQTATGKSKALESLNSAMEFNRAKTEGLSPELMAVHRAHTALLPYVYRQIEQVRSGQLKVPPRVGRGLAAYTFFLITGYFYEEPSSELVRQLQSVVQFMEEQASVRDSSSDPIPLRSELGIAVLQTLINDTSLIIRNPVLLNVEKRRKTETNKRKPEDATIEPAELERIMASLPPELRDALSPKKE